MTKPTKLTKLFAVPALLAALALSATPAAAAELPTIRGDLPVHVSAETADYGGGWGRKHRYRHRGRTSAGDVLGAVIVLGTIAAVANAATRAQRARGYPYPDSYPRYPDRRGDYRQDYRPDYRSSGPRGVEGAADMCLREIERDGRVDEVAEVERDADGWLVTGAMADGAGFSCSIGADGRIERIEIGGRASLPRDYEARSEGGDDRYRGADTRYEQDDDRYYGAEIDAEAEARADSGPLRDYPGVDVEAEAQAQAQAQADDAPLRDYPGGPLPGQTGADDSPEDDPVS